MELDLWTYKSCSAEVSPFDTTASLYSISSKEENKWHASQLLRDAIDYYRQQGKELQGTIALSEAMSHLYKKFWIVEILE